MLYMFLTRSSSTFCHFFSFAFVKWSSLHAENLWSINSMPQFNILGVQTHIWYGRNTARTIISFVQIETHFVLNKWFNVYFGCYIEAKVGTITLHGLKTKYREKYVNMKHAIYFLNFVQSRKTKTVELFILRLYLHDNQNDLIWLR